MKAVVFVACVSLASSLQCYHCNSDNEECDTEKAGTLEDCPSSAPDDILVCATQQVFSTSRICMNLADEYERNMVMNPGFMMGEDGCQGLYCNITDMEFFDLHQENKLNDNSFFTEYTRCVDRFGENTCFHYCDTDGCNNRKSSTPLVEIVVDVIVEPELISIDVLLDNEFMKLEKNLPESHATHALISFVLAILSLIC